MLVGQIPVVKWEDKKISGILNARLLHECYKVILEGTLECSHVAEKMVAPDGHYRDVRIFCGGVIADNPEQGLLSVRQGGASVISEAGPKELGDPNPHRLRTRKAILDTISEAKDKLRTRKQNPIEEPTDLTSPTYTKDMKEYLKSYAKVALKLGLNGVDKPFWENWYLAEPSVFLVPDPLHQWFKLFNDHIFDWAKSLLGKGEIDKRLSVLQPMVGFRHFPNGVTRFKQHTGREQRDLLRYIVLLLYGNDNITVGMLIMFRAFVDYVYLGQYESHSPVTIQYMKDALDAFHKYKEEVAFLRDGPKQNRKFNIPKIEMMHHPLYLIPLLGTTLQYSTEIVERGHIQYSKIPYEFTNHRDSGGQMVRHSDRNAKLDLQDNYLQWRSARQNSQNANGNTLMGDDRDLEPEDPDLPDELYEDSGLDFSMEGSGSGTQNRTGTQSGPQNLRSIQVRHLLAMNMPKPVLNGFELAQEAETDLITANATTVFKLTSRLASLNTPIGQISQRYNLPDLQGAIGDYLQDMFHTSNRRGRRVSGEDCLLPFSNIDVWDHVRMQCKGAQEETVLPFQSVQALPPSEVDGIPFGRCNFVLLKDEEGQDYTGLANGV